MKLYLIITYVLISQCLEAQFNNSCLTPQLVCGNSQFSYGYNEDSTLCDNDLFFILNIESGTGSINISSLFPNSGVAWLYGTVQENSSYCDEITDAGMFVDSTIFNEGGMYTAENTLHFSSFGWHIIQVRFDSCNIDTAGFVNGVKFSFKSVNVNCSPNPIDTCQDCITSFSPNAGKYLVSAWVKEEGATMTTTNYTHSSIQISYSGDPATTSLTPVGRIIDGWQRIEGIVTVPMSATDIHLSFETSSGTSYYDDIRFHPLDGSMMSYVYDPISLRLMAELDERNYATLYEYDEEGKLIRVKKETEKGIMTIQENRDNIRKQ